MYYVIDNELTLVTADNFPKIEGGFPFEMPYPTNEQGPSSNGKSDDYIVGHMFSETSDALNTKAGDIEVREEADITKSSGSTKADSSGNGSDDSSDSNENSGDGCR